ncbi:MAG TPA: orotidine-5'-phosphate decarboxylase [Gammaproteobacteria bacterium]|nr:orotidine-5'-phosphate decarboxylase [Gammaproteobacteria bacterium]
MSIPTRERLIVPLDVPDAERAKALVAELGGAVHFYKIGLELAMTPRYFELLDWLLEQDKRVFADLKFYDIPATVAAAVRQVRDLGATFLTVHGERSVTEAAAAEKGAHLKILAVTVLTSVEQQDLRDVGIEIPLGALAEARAKLALAAGCDGVIASGLEAARLRAALGPSALIVTPGIRPAGTAGGDDQRRVVTPREAFANGADYIVVGRPIRGAPRPREAAETIQAEIADCFA